jgi:hypothetical protein
MQYNKLSKQITEKCKMSNFVENVKLKDNQLLAVYCDTDAESPRKDDNLGTMLCFEHNRYRFGDAQTNSVQQVKSILNSKKYISLPLSIYEHSGVSMSTRVTEYPYTDRWDSSDAGVIYISLELVRKEYNVKKVTKEIRDKVISVLNGEVETYSNYLEGNAYRYELYEYSGDEDFAEVDVEYDISRDNRFTEIDSCSGYIMDESDFIKYVIKEIGGELLT